MGERVVFGIRTSDNDASVVYLYSHWGGYTAKLDLANALARAMDRINMNDDDYATMTIVNQIVGGDWDSDTGYGLSVGSYATPDHGLWEVDLRSRRVKYYDTPWREAPMLVSEYTFDEFIAGVREEVTA
jgi:hypothetical protein